MFTYSESVPQFSSKKQISINIADYVMEALKEHPEDETKNHQHYKSNVYAHHQPQFSPPLAIGDQPVKVLVHNVSHRDLCVTIQPSSVSGVHPNRELMARPRSHRFKFVCDEINKAIRRKTKYSGITYKDKTGKATHVGFHFDSPLRICSWSDFRLRDPNDGKTTSQSLSCVVVRVFFPFLSVLLPEWIVLHQVLEDPEMMDKSHSPELLPFDDTDSEQDDNEHGNDKEAEREEKYELLWKSKDLTKKRNARRDESNPWGDHDSVASTVSQFIELEDIEIETDPCAYKLFLVSGAGHPLKEQAMYHQDDSTKSLATLLSVFIKRYYPIINVKLLHSEQDIFHYSENIKFVHAQLRPAIDRERAALATLHGKQWRKYFNLCITLCDGTPARLSAIVEGLRSFEPDTLHMFRRKTLWINYPKVDRLWDADFEHLKFSQMETYPAIPMNEIHDDMIIDIVQEMAKWKNDYTRNAVNNSQAEMSRFWLRKSYQPVLCILSVQKPDQDQPTYFRGCNVEVSLPTGSLCSERNAIGTASASDPSLRREHFKAVAVLFLGELSKPGKEKKDKQPSPLRSPNLNGQSLRSMKRSVSYTFAQDTDDANPRGPCGSCMEWLKKIAECNPAFKVITFSSRKIDEVIVRNLR